MVPMIDTPPPSPPVVTPPGADVKKRAYPLDESVVERLTPTMKRFCLQERVAVLTGAGRGLGYNMAQALAEAGVRGMAILDLLPEGEQAARELAEQTGVDVLFYPIDITQELVVQQTVQDIMDHFGRIDILINSAGIADSNMPAETYDMHRFRRLIEINLIGNFAVAQAVGQAMIRTNTHGSIINIASMSGSIVNYPQQQSCYNASKAALIQMTKSLAAEWAQYGIRVNAISPGYMDTALNRVPELEAEKKMWIERTPQRRLGGVDELNNLAVLLASDASAFMTGSDIIIDGGYTLW
ncbi:NAD(P)-binding protein [Trematosphaeria pertusa]|uniref:NADP-dependent mannitol dehydrogenase n=1 Tax=Trematosphaeria pertusa TaxID=390896 RepID=A0A6A6IJP8_9PLEO|nr:NAD(P)-binding protein [Trematosphaeria pertusa]KAF2250397.1 NAD(P)-binding protein [Trematosphaeria pertusa]